MLSENSGAVQHYFKDLEELSRAAARMVVDLSRQAIVERGVFSLVLSGRTTPKRLYEILATPPVCNDLDWQKTFIFWGDERFLPLDHPDSNYHLANEHLLACLPAAHVFPVPVGVATPEEAARQYEESIHDFWRGHGMSGPPVFDCLLLGMGADGHCASLFPGSPLLKEQTALVAAVSEPAGSPPVPRITLTLPGLATSRAIIFLACGAEKNRILDELRAGREVPYPVALVRSQGRIHWFTCQD